MENKIYRILARAEQAETLLEVVRKLLSRRYPDVDLLRLLLGVGAPYDE